MSNLIEQLGGYAHVHRMWVLGGCIQDSQLAYS